VTVANGQRIKKALSTSVTEARRMTDNHLLEIKVNGNISRPEPAAGIKNYQRDDGAAFMNNVYAPSLESESDDEQLRVEN